MSELSTVVHFALDPLACQKLIHPSPSAQAAICARRSPLIEAHLACSAGLLEGQKLDRQLAKANCPGRNTSCFASLALQRLNAWSLLPKEEGGQGGRWTIFCIQLMHTQFPFPLLQVLDFVIASDNKLAIAKQRPLWIGRQKSL